MKEVTLKIPDQKFDFFMNLVKELGFEVSEKVEIPEEHKKVVRERVKKSEDKRVPAGPGRGETSGWRTG
jgi:hypothetical protein